MKPEGPLYKKRPNFENLGGSEGVEAEAEIACENLFGYDDISWMRPLETETMIRSYYNAPEIADEIFGPLKGGRYEINYSI